MDRRTFKSDLKLESRAQFLPRLKEDEKFHMKIRNHLFQLEAPMLGWGDEWKSIEAKDLLKSSTSNQKLPKAYIIAGNIGAGKTALARSILNSWLTNNKEFSTLEDYEGVFAIDGEVLDKGEVLAVIKSAFENTISKWSLDVFCDWIESSKILLIIDDFLMDSDEEKNLLLLLDEWKMLDVLILTNKEDGPRILNMIDEIRQCSYSRFKKIDQQLRIDILNFFIKEKIKFSNKTLMREYFFHMQLDAILSEFSGNLMYCQFADEFPQISLDKTISSFIWDVTYNCINKIKNERSLSTERLRDWLFEFGKLCHDNLVANAPLLGEEVFPIYEKTLSIFPNEDRFFLINSLLSRYHNLYSDDVMYSVHHQKQQEVLAAFYVLKKCMEGTPLKRMFKKIKYDRDDDVAIYVAGLLAIFLNEECKSFEIFEDDKGKREKKIERVVKNLALHTERSCDPIAFTMRILHEMHYNKSLITLFLQDAVFPVHLHIHDLGIYSEAIREVCNFSFPLKIHFLIRRGYASPQLHQAVELIKDYNVDLTLAEMNHLNWGSNVRSDSLMKVIFEGTSVKLKDFIGCLGKETINRLHLNEVSKHLVCIRLRVCDVQTAETFLRVQKELRSLMWLEIDFDFDLEQVFSLNISAINIPLIDLNFKGVEDKDVENLCQFLYSISKRFSGLHIHQSHVSTQGMTEILKYFFRRDMLLNADHKTIMKYRRYRFPEIEATDPKQELTDDEVERLLGYDDRRHYSDNEIRSSYVANLQEMNALKHFILMMDIVYFVYSCQNFCLIKEINGQCIVRKSNIS